MVARSGLFVAPVAGAGTAPTDARIAFSALIGTTPQPASGGAITQSAVNMQITVAAGVWQLPDVSNALGTSTFLSPIDQTVVTPAAGPGTGSRVDIVVGKQNNVENADADSRANLFLVAGTAGAPGVAPAVPTGAYLYATVNVPTSAANAAACTVVIARPSTFGALKINSPTFALLSTFAGSLDQRALCAADSITYRYNGTAWKPWESDWIAFTPTLGSGSGSFVSASATMRYKWVSGGVQFWLQASMPSAGSATGNLTATWPVPSLRDANFVGSETAATGYATQLRINGAGPALIFKYDGTTIIATGRTVSISGYYEA